MYWSSESFIFSRDKACNVWQICANLSAQSIVTLSVKSFKLNSSVGCDVFKNYWTLLTSKISHCFGNDGLVSCTLLRNIQTEGWFPKDNWIVQPKVMEDKELPAVLDPLYPLPLWECSPKKLIPSSIARENGLIFVSQQYIVSILTRYFHIASHYLFEGSFHDVGSWW